MKTPSAGEIVYCEGTYHPAPYIICDWGTGSNPDGGWPVNGAKFNEDGNAHGYKAMLYSTKDEALSANVPSGQIACWREPNPSERLINELIAVLAEYSASL